MSSKSGSAHYMINMEVAGSVCQTVKVSFTGPKLRPC